MPAHTVFQIPTSARNALKKLSHGNLSHALIKIIKENAATIFDYEPDPATRTGIVCDQDTIDILDNIVARNNLKSRNQAVTLLIEKAWKERETLAPNDPCKSDQSTAVQA